MKEDASLFKYELAFTIIIKNGAPYMKEWIDFHRLAFAAIALCVVLQPYIEKGIVEYEECPGQRPQCAAYNKAVKDHRWDCRYMGFIDDDEFVYPTGSHQTIKDVLHEVLDGRPQAVALTVDRANFGSSGHEKADYSTDVIDRFQHRGKQLHSLPKNIVNPRMVNYVDNPHYMNYFDGKVAVNPNGEINAIVDSTGQKLVQVPPVADKIVLNHYYLKSLEEWAQSKLTRGDVFFVKNDRDMKIFYERDKEYNAVFDNEIVKYRDARRDRILNGGGATEQPSVMYNRVFRSMHHKILPGMSPSSPNDIFVGKTHEFLTCYYISRYLNNVLIDGDSAKFLEELSLKCLYRALAFGDVEIWQLQLLFQELPSILHLKYTVVKDIKEACCLFIPQLKQQYRMQNNWRRYNQYDYLLDMLKGSD